jgi:hypothetical protein
VESTSCEADGNFGPSFCIQYPKISDVTTPKITNIRFTITETGGIVRGDMDFNGAWRIQEVRGNVAGGRMSISGSGTIPAQGLTFAIESWDSVLSGATGMTGDFTWRVYATAGSPSGSSRYKVRLVNLTK